MLEVDLHTHSFFSACGLHTHMEILTRAKALGMNAVAITDHGATLSPRVSSPFYDRLHTPLDGIKLLKGMECNLVNDQGEIDLPMNILQYLDVVLLGIHPNTPTGLGKEKYTEMLVAAIEMNPAVDILTHLNDLNYPVDFATVISAATEKGVAIELNNSKTLLQRCPDDITRQLVAAANALESKIVVTSDMHALEELGQDSAVKHFLDEENYPSSRIVSLNAEATYSFLELRKKNKR